MPSTMPKPREFPLWLKIIINLCGPVGVALALLGIINAWAGLGFFAVGVAYVSWELYPSASKSVKRSAALSLPIFLSAGALLGACAWLVLLKATPHQEELSADEEKLCPHPLRYSLRALPKPKDDNYATELTVKSDGEPMLTVDIYLKTYYSQANQTYPENAKDQLIILQQFEWDKSHLKWVATKGASEFRLEIHTFQPLRLKCVNQAN